MCRIFAGQSPEVYSSQTRSVRLGGHSTSIRLEAAFWGILEEIAAAENISLAKFLTTLHDEVLELRGEAMNFTSLLRCACLTYVAQRRRRDEVVATPSLFASEASSRSLQSPV
jgi:predicted DNA-binding ribbon-helix-helix protein